MWPVIGQFQQRRAELKRLRGVNKQNAAVTKELQDFSNSSPSYNGLQRSEPSFSDMMTRSMTYGKYDNAYSERQDLDNKRYEEGKARAKNKPASSSTFILPDTSSKPWPKMEVSDM